MGETCQWASSQTLWTSILVLLAGKLSLHMLVGPRSDVMLQMHQVILKLSLQPDSVVKAGSLHH